MLMSSGCMHLRLLCVLPGRRGASGPLSMQQRTTGGGGSSSDDDGDDDGDAASAALLGGASPGFQHWSADSAAAAAAAAQGVLVKDILSAEEQLQVCLQSAALLPLQGVAACVQGAPVPVTDVNRACLLGAWYPEQRAGADAAAAAGDDQDGADGTGIILARQAKPTAAPAGGQPRDLAVVADAVQKLCQVAAPLSRSLEFLQEDLEAMSKEYRCNPLHVPSVHACMCTCVHACGAAATQARLLGVRRAPVAFYGRPRPTHNCPVQHPRAWHCRFWVTERRVYQERLATELKAAADTSDLEGQVKEREAAIGAARARILALRSQVRCVCVCLSRCRGLRPA
jgi:hypothetical protein